MNAWVSWVAAAWMIVGWTLAAAMGAWKRARARRDPQRERGEESFEALLERLQPKSPGVKALEAAAMVVVSGLLGPLVLVGWWKAARTRPARHLADPFAEPEDALPLVRAETLVERATVEAVEAEWQVVDPLGGAPEVPFGHLNARWKALVDAMQDGDELWRFEGERGNRWFRERVAGYAVLRGAEPVAHWVCERLGRVDADA